MLAAKLALAAVLTIAATGAQAASRGTTLSGTAFSIDSPCAHHVGIQPDPALHGTVTISATAEHQEELDHLVFETKDRGGRAVVQVHTVPDGCWQPAPLSSFEPTIDIVVRVPLAFAVSVDESGAGRYVVGDIGGPLSLDISGAAHIMAAHATTLDVDLSGSGAVTLARAEGNASIKVSGHGTVGITEATATDFTVDLSGAGAVTVGRGRIGTASLDESGFGQISIGGEVGDAKVDISGAGSVHFAKLTGSLDKDVSGAGSVSVGQ